MSALFACLEVLDLLRATCTLLILIAGPVTAVAQSTTEPVPSEKPLPEIVVRPEVSPDQAPANGNSSSPAPATPQVEPFDLSEVYPGLSDQMVGGASGTGLDSALRGQVSVFNTPSLTTIVDRNAIEQKQARDMFQALQNEVGVLMQQTARGQTSPFVRGLTGQQVLILVDGVRMNNSTFRTGPNQYFNLIDPGQVERIEVIRGPQSVLWGSDAIGGAINIVTRSASPQRGNYTGGSFTQYFSTADTASYSRGSIEGWAGATGLFAGGSYTNVNELERGGGLGEQPFTDYHQYSGDLKLNHALGCDHLITVAFQHFEQHDLPRSDRFPPFVFGPPAGTPRPTFFDPQQRDLVYFRLQGLAYNTLFDAYTSTVSYARNKEGTSSERSPTRTDLSEFDVNTLGYNLTLAKDLGFWGHFTCGFDYYYDDVDSVRDRLDPTTGIRTPSNAQFPDNSRYQRLGAFLNWDVALTQNLDATAGVRYENADAHGTLNDIVGTPLEFDRTYQDWIGSVGLVYEVDPSLRFVGSVSEGYRAPNLDDLASDNPVLQNAQDVPSLDVEPEHAMTYEVGIKYDSPKLRVQLFEFWTHFEDSIQRQAVDGAGNPLPNVIGPNGTSIPGSSNFIRDNFETYLNGTEFAAEYIVGCGWSVYGNFWYTYGQDLDRNEPLSRIPPTQGIAGVRWQDARQRRWLDVYGWFVGRQDRYATQNNTDARFPLGGTPGYATLNVRAGTSLGCSNQHRLSLTLENITDKDYRVLGSGVDGPGFNAIFGYQWIY